MFAHANYVLFARDDECNLKKIQEIESSKDIAKKSIAQKEAIIENLSF